ncbi:MAG TPA: DUF4416 family protein [bacterium]|nr:DUF4416 family protein [bacterium]
MRDKPKPVKLFCGLVGRAEAIERARGPLVQAFGEPDCESATLKFDFTAYYRDEMGEGLVRRWLAFGALRERAYLARAKHIAALIEEQLAVSGKRRVNLDPGYVDDAQVVLSTAKNFSHRIYIGMGYYAEVTLTYEHKAFKLLPWTYPDYQTGEALAFFGQARSIYIAQLRHRADK